MTARLSAVEWAELVQAFEQSGQSARAFAKEHGVTDATLRWLRTQLRVKGRPRAKRDTAATPAAVTLVRVVREGEVMPSEEGWPRAGSVSVIVGTVRVMVEEGFSAALLRAVVAALRSPA